MMAVLAAILDSFGGRAGHNTAVVLAGTMLLGVAAGVVGVFAMLRRRSLMADALSHATLPGICLAFLLATAVGSDGRSLAVLLPGAAATGVAGLLIVNWLTRATRISEDAAIGAVLSVFFGVGVVLLSVIQALPTGNQGGLKGLLFGQTATMHAADAMLLGVVAIASIIAVTLAFKQLGLVAFNDEFASAIGVPVRAIDLLLMSLVVMVTVSGLVAVGLVLVVAMLIIPAAAARLWTDRLRTMAVLAAVFGGTASCLGVLASSRLDRTPTGPSIVLAAGCIFLLGMIGAPRRGVVAGLGRQALVAARVHADHALRSLLASPQDPRPIGVVLPPGVIGRLARARLRRLGLVRVNGSMIVLTPEGEAEARLAERRRRLWERYLVTHAEVAPSHVDISADAIEHVVDPEIVARLEAELAADDARRVRGGADA